MTIEERRARRLVRERSNGVCEKCDRACATEFQHRVRRSQGGQWTASCGLHLCHKCHTWITRHPDQARIQGGWHLRRGDDPLLSPVLLALRGWVLLNDRGAAVPCDPPTDLTGVAS